ncbi:MAG: ATP-binding protein [Cyclobacteriaceae bacterium]
MAEISVMLPKSSVFQEVLYTVECSAMVFKNFRINVIIRVLLLVLIIATLSYCLIHQLYLRSIYVAIALIIAIGELLRYVEKTNRDLTSFLSALSQNDFTTIYSEKDRGKSFNNLYSVFNQITNKFRAISESKEAQFIFLSLLVEHIRVGILSIDERDQIHLINQSMRNYLANTTVKNLADLSGQEREIVNVFRTIRAGESQLIKKTIDGKIIPLTIHASEIRLQGQYFKLISAQDIRNELEANELEAWQKLIRVLTHEIMNSVSPIISLSSTLHNIVNENKKEEELGAEEKITLQKGLEAIKIRSKGLQYFANAYRSLTKIPQPQFQKVQFKNIIDRLTTLFKEEFNLKGIQLQLDIKSEESEVFADAELLEQVLINLLRNAIDAVADQPQPVINVRIETSGTSIIQIEDNGAGIDEDKIDKVFIPFFTTKKSGSGIGLALSKQIVLMHGGQISLTSKVGAGTTVEIRL